MVQKKLRPYKAGYVRYSFLNIRFRGFKGYGVVQSKGFIVRRFEAVLYVAGLMWAPRVVACRLV
jgi:hypothetical protein